jgi:hypothetical protein
MLSEVATCYPSLEVALVIVPSLTLGMGPYYHSFGLGKCKAISNGLIKNQLISVFINFYRNNSSLYLSIFYQNGASNKLATSLTRVDPKRSRAESSLSRTRSRFLPS